MDKHPLTVEGFEGSLRDLAQKVCRMRYDKVSEFFDYCGDEIGTQAEADYLRSRKQLSGKLNQMALALTFGISGQFSAIFELCKPHMKDELAGES